MTQLVGAGRAAAANGWTVFNNVWNPGKLVAQRDYTVSSNHDTADMTAGTFFSWRFPGLATPWPTILAYPEVMFGASPNYTGVNATDKDNVLPVQVGDIAALTARHDLRWGGLTQGYNVAYDIWLTDVPGGRRADVTNEVMIWLHPGGISRYGAAVGTYKDANFSAAIYHDASRDYTAVIADTDQPRGAVDIAAILGRLRQMGIVSWREYLADIELGAEVAYGSGWLTVKDLEFDLRTKGWTGPARDLTVTGSGVARAVITGTAGDDQLTGTQGNDIIRGGAGKDRVSLPGDRIQYGISRTADGGLKLTGGGRTDILYQVESLAFRDRTVAAAALARPGLDFNGDGKNDILWQNGDHQIRIWSGGLQSGSSMSGALGRTWHVAGAGDFNGDGTTDILLQAQNGQAGIWLKTGDGVSHAGGALDAKGGLAANPGTRWQVMGAGDFNGDGKADILWQRDDGLVKIWTMNGNRRMGEGTVGRAAAKWRIAGIADLNGDSKADIVWQNGQGQALVWLMNGYARSGIGQAAGHLGTDWSIAGLGDLNGDGNADIVWQDDSGATTLYLMNGANRLKPGRVVDTQGNAIASPGPGWRVAGVQDLNGDGLADLLWQNSSGKAAVWTMDGFTRTGTLAPGNPGSAWHVAAG